MKELLTLRQKIKFFAEHKVWLESYSAENEDFGIFSYREKTTDTWRTRTRWIVTKINDEIQFTKVSTFREYSWYEKKDDGLYLFGTEGIFYKADKEKPLVNIFTAKDIVSMQVFETIGLVLIFRADGRDIILRVEHGNIHIISENIEIVAKKDYYLGREVIRRFHNKDVGLILHKEEKYFYVYINGNTIYTPNITLDENYQKLFKELPVIVYDEKSGTNKVAKLIDNKIKFFGEYDNIKLIENGYYIATSKKRPKEMMIFSEHNNKELKSFPYTEKWSVLGKILYVILCKFEMPDGIRLVTIYKDRVKSEFYPKAVDIEFEGPVILENGNVIEIKPLPIYKETVNDL